MSRSPQQMQQEIILLQKRLASASQNYAAKFIEDGRRDYFCYQATATTLAAAGVAVDQVQIEADANFYWTKTQAFGLIADDAPTVAPAGVIPSVTVQIQDTGSSRNLFNEAVPLSAIAGQGGLPFVLDYPRMLARNSTLQVTFTNISDNTTYSDVFLTFVGFKVYPGGN